MFRGWKLECSGYLQLPEAGIYTNFYAGISEVELHNFTVSRGDPYLTSVKDKRFSLKLLFYREFSGWLRESELEAEVYISSSHCPVVAA